MTAIDERLEKNLSISILQKQTEKAIYCFCYTTSLLPSNKENVRPLQAFPFTTSTAQSTMPRLLFPLEAMSSRQRASPTMHSLP
jgi:hypothetical protein